MVTMADLKLVEQKLAEQNKSTTHISSSGATHGGGGRSIPSTTPTAPSNPATSPQATAPTVDPNKAAMEAAKQAYNERVNQGMYDTGGSGGTSSSGGQVIYAQPEQPDINAMLEEMKRQRIASRIASAEKVKTSALGALDDQQAAVDPYYYDKRNQAAAASDVGAMNFAQYMAARGIKGAAGAMPEIYRNAGLQGQIGALDRQQAAENSAIERQRSMVKQGYATDIAAAEADVESQAMQAAIDQWNNNRQYALQQAAQDLNESKFDWSKSPSNPEYQSQIYANQLRALDVAAQEIKNSYLPETEKMRAELLRQQVAIGKIDPLLAQAQLDQIRAQIRSTDALAAQREANSNSYSEEEIDAIINGL